MAPTLTAAALLTLVATPAAAAGFACVFTTECLGTEPCAETVFEADIAATGDTVTLVSDAQTIPGALDTTDEAGTVTYFLGIAGAGVHLITLSPDGVATYSAHVSDIPLALTYHGTCSEAD